MDEQSVTIRYSGGLITVPFNEIDSVIMKLRDAKSQSVPESFPLYVDRIQAERLFSEKYSDPNTCRRRVGALWSVLVTNATQIGIDGKCKLCNRRLLATRSVRCAKEREDLRSVVLDIETVIDGATTFREGSFLQVKRKTREDFDFLVAHLS